MKSITAIICITALIAWALYLRIDGLLLAGGIAALAGLGGFAVHELPLFKRQKPNEKE